MVFFTVRLFPAMVLLAVVFLAVPAFLIAVFLRSCIVCTVVSGPRLPGRVDGGAQGRHQVDTAQQFAHCPVVRGIAPGTERRGPVIEAAGLKVRALEEAVLRLKELLFQSTVDVAVLSADVNQGHLPSLRTAAIGIDRDRDADMGGLALPWNSGVAEGHVNRIKMLRRQMSGLACFALLRKRVLPAW
ncbi:hypothetical protein ACFU98_38910 [Streptomyces sp. NPDC057575]|uniref:hypothetical protein n=1 Tax=unclassified Streptomyces TaxID=2593676 RepID=UPI00368D602E